jgi:hypothetical protein
MALPELYSQLVMLFRIAFLEFFIMPNFEVQYGQTTPENVKYVRVPALRMVEELPPSTSRGLCLDQAKASLVENTIGNVFDAEIVSLMLSQYVSCVEANLTSELLDTSSQIQFLSDTLNTAKDYFENYTCVSDLPTSSPIRNETWTDKGKSYDIGILLDRPRSKIHLVSNFISEEECTAVEEAANPILQVAVVDDGKGGSEVSKHRKAMQAGIRVNWDKEPEGDLVARLSRRVYDYANHVLGLNLRENGQEDLMSIQYFGRGANDTEPDRYFPHCDGACGGLPHKEGGRIATMVLYCTIPLIGGATNFRKAGIHVEPKKFFGTFFSYIGPEDGIMDDGFTEHSGCPVVDGEKKIVTQWLRLGVDDDHPHSKSLVSASFLSPLSSGYTELIFDFLFLSSSF